MIESPLGFQSGFPRTRIQNFVRDPREFLERRPSKPCESSAKIRHFHTNCGSPVDYAVEQLIAGLALRRAKRSAQIIGTTSSLLSSSYAPNGGIGINRRRTIRRGLCWDNVFCRSQYLRVLHRETTRCNRFPTTPLPILRRGPHFRLLAGPGISVRNHLPPASSGR